MESAKIDLIFASGGTNISDIRAQYPSAHSIINGPYFGYDKSGAFMPAGLLVQDGKRLGVVDYSDPNLAYFFVISSSGAVSITAREMVSSGALSSAHIAFQSGPLLIQSGSVVVHDDASWHAGSAHERTAIGVDTDGHISWFVAQKPMMLRDFASEIHRRESKIQMLLNLDGGPSTAFFTSGSVSFRSDVRLPFFFIQSSK